MIIVVKRLILEYVCLLLNYAPRIILIFIETGIFLHAKKFC